MIPVDRIEELIKANIFGGGSSVIKSIQRGIATINSLDFSVPITTVDPSKSIVLVNYYPAFATQWNSRTHIRGYLSGDGSAVYLAVYAYYSNIYAAWQVIEFNNIKSLQSGLLTNSSNLSSLTVTVNSVNLAKSILFCSYQSKDGTETLKYGLPRYYLSDSTTITFENCDKINYINWYVVEFN